MTAADGLVQQRPGAVVAPANHEPGDQSGRGTARLLHLTQSDLLVRAVRHRHHARSRLTGTARFPLTWKTRKTPAKLLEFYVRPGILGMISRFTLVSTQ